jgi:LysM repeat protein
MCLFFQTRGYSMSRKKTIQGLLPLFLIFILMNVLVVVAQQGDAAGITYEVRTDDETLEGVAERFEKPVECIALANELEVDADLIASQALFIPDDCDGSLGQGGGANILEMTPTAEILTGTVTATPRPTSTPSPTPTLTPTPSVAQNQTYVVVPGDRLSKIAEAYGVTLACLVRANRIANPDLIYVGQQLLISASCQGGGGGDDIIADPVSAGRTCQFDRYPGRTAPSGVYTIRAGDTLDFIACDFGISLQCLRESNPQVVNNKRLAIGDQLTISLACPGWEGAVIPSG